MVSARPHTAFFSTPDPFRGPGRTGSSSPSLSCMMHPFLPLELAQDGSPRARRSLRRAAVLTAGAALLSWAGLPAVATAQVMQVRPVTP